MKKNFWKGVRPPTPLERPTERAPEGPPEGVSEGVSEGPPWAAAKGPRTGCPGLSGWDLTASPHGPHQPSMNLSTGTFLPPPPGIDPSQTSTMTGWVQSRVLT